MVSMRGRELKRRWMLGALALVVTGCLLYGRSGQCVDPKPQRQLSQDTSASTCEHSREDITELKRTNAALAQQVRKLEAQLLDARATAPLEAQTAGEEASERRIKELEEEAARPEAEEAARLPEPSHKEQLSSELLGGDHTTSALPPIYNAMNEQTKESFENTCRRFREDVPPEKRLLGIAGRADTSSLH